MPENSTVAVDIARHADLAGQVLPQARLLIGDSWSTCLCNVDNLGDHDPPVAC